ncbi:MAG: hypothetical protein QF793_01925 [Candidatus Peribacteraceae bacterium]|jgi:hypothetical protein|nr:hypothetical protein [bacterium]MDP6561661.1 hypothetical protein [Candidatus Peribacteraceae bacterium]|tara:strand:- start:2001 stop:2387 length:387 start_codon:yes stop_codon:yes gene_type:complete
MADFYDQVATAADLTREDQKKVGAPIAGSIGTEHRDFLKTLKKMLEAGEIDPHEPKSLLNKEIYDALDEEWQEKTDLALLNIANQLRLIADFLHSAETPAESPQLQTMVEHLWQSKQQIEEHHDVFKF